MTPREYFATCCRELNLDFEALFDLSVGNPQDATRFKHSSSHLRRKSTQIYTVKFFEKERLYIAWELDNLVAKQKDVFTLQKAAVLGTAPNQIKAINKPTGSPTWPEETVFVIPYDEVKRFLSEHIIPLVAR